MDQSNGARRDQAAAGTATRLVVVGRDCELARALEAESLPMGWQLAVVEDVSRWTAFGEPGDVVVVDVCPGGVPCLECIETVRKSAPHATLLAITAYPCVSLAVAAIKAGASSCLSRPVHPVEILNLAAGDNHAGRRKGPAKVPSLDQVEWDYILRVLDDLGGNISRAARVLRIQRSTLQRRLKKCAPKNPSLAARTSHASLP